MMFFKRRLPILFSNKLDEHIKSFSDGKISDISSIFSVFGKSSSKSKLKASKFLLELITERQFTILIRILEHMHGSYNLYYRNNKWYNIKIEDLFTIDMSQEERKAVLVFASFHSNGYLREKAIKELLHYPDTLKYILIRRNDWVNEVRNTAKKLLLDKYKNLVEGELLNAIPAIEKLIKCERNDFKNEYDFFVLKLKENENELYDGLNSQNPNIRLFCAQLLSKQASKMDCLKLFLTKEKMPYIREIIYKHLIGNNSILDKDLLEMILNDKYAKIRLIGMDYVYVNKLKEYDFAIDFLLDRNANVRNCARYIIKQINNDFSYREFYLKEIQNNNLNAIVGIGETGIKEDTLLLEEYMNSKDTKNVRMTLNALIKLDKEKYIKDFILLLDDDRVGIVKDIATILKKESLRFEEEINDIFNKSIKPFTRLKCIQLLFSVSKWNALNNMILALDDENPKISEFAKLSIEKWILKFNKSFITLASEKRNIIINNLSKIKRKDINAKQILYYLK